LLNARFLVPFGQLLATDDFEQVAKLNAVGKVAQKVLDLHHALHEERVAPTRKCSLLDLHPRLRAKKMLSPTMLAPFEHAARTATLDGRAAPHALGSAALTCSISSSTCSSL
jgi:hypothetical protein